MDHMKSQVEADIARLMAETTRLNLETARCNAAEHLRIAREARFYPLISWVSLLTSIVALIAVLYA